MPAHWMTFVEAERQRRIRVALAAYTDEIEDDPLFSDETFDNLCARVDLSIKTGHDELDTFFETHFTPHTGMWIYEHPDLEGLKRLSEQLRCAVLTHKAATV